MVVPQGFVAVFGLQLSQMGQPLWTAIGPIEEVLERLYQRFQFQRAVSHQETGPGWTYQRDLKVKRWCEDTVKWATANMGDSSLQQRQVLAMQWAASWIIRNQRP